MEKTRKEMEANIGMTFIKDLENRLENLNKNNIDLNKKYKEYLEKLYKDFTDEQFRLETISRRYNDIKGKGNTALENSLLKSMEIIENKKKLINEDFEECKRSLAENLMHNLQRTVPNVESIYEKHGGNNGYNKNIK